MNSLVKRDRSTFADLVDWLESEFPTIPSVRQFAGLQMMRVEDFQDGNEYVVRAELPGVDPDKDIDIQLLDGVLTIKAERREENKDANRSEFRYGSFSRSLTLPAGADENNVKATYKDGILEIRVPLKEEQQPEPRHITVAKD
ncbi:MAG TPA: Hsp20/alpha crystallin family protein [Kribbella sp.]